MQQLTALISNYPPIPAALTLDKINTLATGKCVNASLHDTRINSQLSRNCN